MLTENQLVSHLRDIGAVRKKHVVLVGGRHSDDYVDLELLFPRTALFSTVCRSLALECLDMREAEVIIGPERGATYLAPRLAEKLGERCCGREILSLDARKGARGKFFIPEHLEPLVAGKKVLGIDDVLTTGRSLRKTLDLAEKLGGTVIGACCVWNRGGVTADELGVPRLASLINILLPSWEAAVCTNPKCRLLL